MIYIYVYIYIHMCIYIYIYMYKHRYIYMMMIYVLNMMIFCSYVKNNQRVKSPASCPRFEGGTRSRRHDTFGARDRVGVCWSHMQMKYDCITILILIIPSTIICTMYDDIIWYSKYSITVYMLVWCTIMQYHMFTLLHGYICFSPDSLVVHSSWNHHQ